MATKIFPADKVFSDLIRERDKWTCQRCGGQFLSRRALHCSHFYSRGKWATRYDPENCVALCYGCHRYWDKHINEYEKFKIAQLGQQAFNALTLRAWARSPLGSAYWKKLSLKQAEEVLTPLFKA